MSCRLSSLHPHRFLRLAVATCAVALLAPSAFAAKSDDQPIARSADVVDHVFGNTLHDPYRWMEGDKNTEFLTWLSAQGDYTRTRLDTLPTLKAWQETLSKTSTDAVIHRLQRQAGGKLFFIRQAGQGNGTLMVRDADGSERVLLDPATLAGSNSHASITMYTPSPDGSKVAVNADRSGSEVARLEVYDVKTGKPFGDTVESVWGGFAPHWLPDSSGFAYTQMAPPDQRTNGDPLQDARVRFHRLGTPTAQDPILLRAGTGEGANPSFPIPSNRFVELDFPASSRWTLAVTGSAQPELSFCVAPQDEAIKPGVTWRCIAGMKDQVHDAAIHGDTLYLISTLKHSSGEVLAIDLSKPGASLADARSILVPEGDNIVVGMTMADAEHLAPARDALYLRVIRNGIDSIRRIDYATGKSDPVAMPLAGAASLFHISDDQDGFLLELRGWTTPPKSWRYDPKDRAMHTLGQDQSSPADYSMIETTETEYVSKDGTHLSLTVLHRKDAVLDGSHRAILYGYGSYGISVTPAFAPVRLEWVKRGNIFAYAHVRGGGEKGEAWHLAGKGANKHKGVEDFVAGVAALDKLGYSRPQRTGLISRSAGGVLIGGAVVNHPKAFGAAVFQVSFTNPVRLMQAPNGPNQIGEFGDPRKAEDFPFMLAADPYQNIKPNTAYPAVMMDVGLNDGRVAPWMTGKFAARLQASTSSGKPVWLRTDANGGHGIQHSLGAEATEFADIFAFMDAQLPAP